MKKIVLLVFVSVVLLSAMLPLTKESISSSGATIYVDPSTNDVSVGNTFVINVSVADVADLSSFGFYLGYNTIILDVLSVWVPKPFETPIKPQIFDPDGYVIVTATSTIPFSGSSTLASITFNATAVGSSILDLYDTILLDSANSSIPHTTIDGSVTVSSAIITVPDDYLTIQEAINAASDGDTIFVRADTYCEHVVVNKSISLIGESRGNTIVDGSGTGTIINVTANSVNINGFTIQNSGHDPMSWRCGIFLDHSNNNVIHENTLTHNDIPLFLQSSDSNNISQNFIIENFFMPIFLSNSKNNVIVANEISRNQHGMQLHTSGSNKIIDNVMTDILGHAIDLLYESNNIVVGNTIQDTHTAIYIHASDNIIYHNKFINNTYQAWIVDPHLHPNVWDNGYPSGGNYWSDYIAMANDTYSGPFQNEKGSDGIGDAPYIIDVNNQDNYPLMSPWGPVHNTNTGLHYQTIQAAIDAPETLDRHTILVDVGTYYEHVRIDKNGLRLIGENRSTTIIDGNGTGSPISIIANSVTVTGFKIRNSRFEYLYSGIRVDDCDHNNITGNTLMNNFDGIFLTYSSNNTICDNIIINNDWNGIHLKYNSNHNVISSNTLLNNRNGIDIEVNSNDNHVLNNYIADSEWDGIDLKGSQNNSIKGNTITNCFTGIYLGLETDNMNVIYHNNFINNMYQVTCYSAPNMWDNDYPSGGNYWSDYIGLDLFSGPYQNETGSDGIGDAAYGIDEFNQDNYPLMSPISFFNSGTWDETTYYVDTVSNSTISDFYFSESEKLISFNVTGPDDTVGFCRVAIPNELLWCDNPEQWQVWVNNTLIEDRKITEDAHYTYIYFTYNHSSQNVEVIGVHVTPEFPTWTSILLMLIVLTVAIALYKRRLLKTPIH